MRKYLIERTVYSFDELSSEAKEHAITGLTENDYMSYLLGSMEDYLTELLRGQKITYKDMPNIQYSLNYCQGDGAMFEGVIYYKSYTITVKHEGFHSHYNSKNINIESTKTGKDASQKVYDQFNDVYVNICQELAKFGYSKIEYASSEEYISELCEINEYEFTKYGNLDNKE